MTAKMVGHAELLESLRRQVEGCTRCPLHDSRTQVVFGSGNPAADLFFVGEAPGAEEDRSGVPFVGRSGRLLERMLETIGISRQEVFISNVVKCRPPENRDPSSLEIETCSPYLERQIELVEPRVICSLGNFATRLLSGEKRGITQIHGVPRKIKIGSLETTLFPLFHPAAALRSPAYASGLQEDFARIPELLGSAEGE
jgi:uracil-DNA glycosylase family 4